MKLVLALIATLVLAGCSATPCDEACYKAKQSLEESRHKMQMEAYKIEQEYQLKLMSSTWYREKLSLDIENRQTKAVESSANDLDYVATSTKIKDAIAVWSVIYNTFLR